MNVARTVGWLPFTPNLRAASARLRCYDLVLQLTKMGHSVDVVDAGDTGSHRIVVLSKRYDDAALELAQRVRRQGGSVVLDLCDNHFYDSAGREDGAERARQLSRTLHEVDHLVVSTPALGSVIQR